MKEILGTFAAAALLAGCMSITESTTPVSGAPALQPTSAWVQVTRVQPARPYQALAQIELEIPINPDLGHSFSSALGEDEMDKRLRASGGAYGADAVLITFDRVMPRAGDVDNSQATRRNDSEWKRRIVAVAIKYRE